MKLINGRTPEQWRAYDRAKLTVALLLGVVLVGLWLAGGGPLRAGACCAVPEGEPRPAAAAAGAAVPPASTPPAEEEAPVGRAAPPEDDCPRTIDADVAFVSGSAELTSAGRGLLESLAHCLAEGRYEVAGHADSSGSNAINDPLAEARALTVVEHLVAAGVDRGRLTARGYGSSRPVADNATPEGRARNRRVEIHDR